MSVQTQQSRRHGGYVDRPSPSGLADVIEIILDKGIQDLESDQQDHLQQPADPAEVTARD